MGKGDDLFGHCLITFRVSKNTRYPPLAIFCRRHPYLKSVRVYIISYFRSRKITINE
jgi:hypothetical protein